MGDIRSYLGFAVRSGNILYGIDSIQASNKKKYAMVICRSASENLVGKATAYANKNNIPLIYSEEPLEFNVNRFNCKLIAITDVNLAKAVIGTNGR